MMSFTASFLSRPTLAPWHLTNPPSPSSSPLYQSCLKRSMLVVPEMPLWCKVCCYLSDLEIPIQVTNQPFLSQMSPSKTTLTSTMSESVGGASSASSDTILSARYSL